MADMFNFNTGDSSSAGYNSQYQRPAVDAQSVQNVEYQHNWYRTPRPFGLNVRVPETPAFIGENTSALIKKQQKNYSWLLLKKSQISLKNMKKYLTVKLQTN